MGSVLRFDLRSRHEQPCCQCADPHLHQRKLFETELQGLPLGPHWGSAVVVPGTPAHQVVFTAADERLTLTLAAADGSDAAADADGYELQPGKKGAALRFHGHGTCPVVKLQIPHGRAAHVAVLRCELASAVDGAVLARASARFTLLRKLADAVDTATGRRLKRKDGDFVRPTRQYTRRKDAVANRAALGMRTPDVVPVAGRFAAMPPLTPDIQPGSLTMYLGKGPLAPPPPPSASWLGWAAGLSPVAELPGSPDWAEALAQLQLQPQQQQQPPATALAGAHAMEEDPFDAAWMAFDCPAAEVATPSADVLDESWLPAAMDWSLCAMLDDVHAAVDGLADLPVSAFAEVPMWASHEPFVLA